MTRAPYRHRRLRAPLLAALLLVPAGAAQPQTANLSTGPGAGRQQLEIVGSSAPSCLIQPGVTAQGSNATFQADSASAGTVQIGQFADASTAQANAMQIRLTLPLICNSAHSIVLHSRNGGMLRIGGSRTTSGAFGEFLPYRVSSDWAGMTGSARSDDAKNLQFNVPNGGQGLLTVDIAIDKGTAPLVAGSYEDTLQIDVAASN